MVFPARTKRGLGKGATAKSHLLVGGRRTLEASPSRFPSRYAPAISAIATMHEVRARTCQRLSLLGARVGAPSAIAACTEDFALGCESDSRLKRWRSTRKSEAVW